MSEAKFSTDYITLSIATELNETNYLVPVGDTTITHFAMSDEKGNVLLKEVPVGRYEVNAEMIGYTPHKKEYGVQAHWEAYDLGIIRLEENPEYIDAASISAVGNPIIVKKDTIEFNAAAFIRYPCLFNTDSASHEYMTEHFTM